MNALVVAILLVVLVTLLPNRREGFSEFFHKPRPTREVEIYDAVVDKSKYDEFEPKINSETMNKFVLQTNMAIQKRVNAPTYIIETTAIRAYRHREFGERDTLYEIQYLVVKQGGMPHGFAVVSTIHTRGDAIEILALNTQPLDIRDDTVDSSVYESSTAKEFLDLDEVRGSVNPTALDLNKFNMRQQQEG